MEPIRLSIHNSSTSSSDELALMQAYTQKQKENLNFQQLHYDEWKQEDASRYKSNKSSSVQDRFELSSIALSEELTASLCIYGNWNPIKLVKKQYISNKILRSLESHSLKTQGVKVVFEVELGERCEVWVMSRDASKSAISQTCIKIGRDLYNERIFVKLGAYIGPNNEFQFFKSYEIAADIMMYSNFTVQYFDYGNEYISVSILNSEQKHTFRCNKFVPVFNPCYVMIAGIGTLVCIEKLDISVTERIFVEEDSNRCKCSIY